MKEPHALQARICGQAPPLPPSAKVLLRHLRRMLQSACEADLLRNTLDHVFKHLRFKPAPPFYVLICGRESDRPLRHRGRTIARKETNFDRDPSFPHFERADGAWFDFSILVEEKGDGLELLAYDFELRFPRQERWPIFLRYDLNLPGHDNEDGGLRSHVHPGHDELLAPAPLCSPLELLDLFLHGLTPRNPDKPRA